MVEPLLPKKDEQNEAVVDWTKVNAAVNMGLAVTLAVLLFTKVVLVNAEHSRGWTMAETLLRIPSDNWGAYLTNLETNPVFVKAVTSGTVYSVGDIIAQLAGGKQVGELDRPRVLKSCAAGFIGHGPLSHVWYNWSEELFNDVLHIPAVWWSFFPKVMIDQTVWTPLWNNVYILLVGVMSSASLREVFGDMKRTTLPLMASGLKLWPFAHIVTYGLIPVENRLLWVDLVEIAWVTILSSELAASDESEAAATGGEATAAGGEATVLATSTEGAEVDTVLLPEFDVKEAAAVER